VHNEPLSIVAVRVCNPDCSPALIYRRNTAPTPPTFAKIVGDDLPILQELDCASFVLHTSTTKNPFSTRAHGRVERAVAQFCSRGLAEVKLVHAKNAKWVLSGPHQLQKFAQ
jgi:hypothetical protein